MLDKINLSDTHQQVIQILGQPLKETQADDTLILRYGSNAPTLAHYIHLQNNQVVFKSTSTYADTTQTLQQFIDQHGSPRQSLINADADTHDSLRLTTHVWPDQGMAVTSIGQDPQNQVTRIFEFQSTTLENYLSTWGKNLAGHTIATVPQEALREVGPSPTPTPKQPLISTLSIILIFLFILIISFISYRLRRRSKTMLQSSREY